MNETSQIWRFPKKYSELFKNISNEDTGIIIKELFFGDGKTLQGLNKAYYEIIKIDLDNLEKTAINGKKGGRPKKEENEITGGYENEITGGYENEKPEVMKNNNLKERKREREREREREIEVYRKFNHLSLSIEEFNKLNKNYTKEAIDDILNAIENYKKNKDYVSLYLTANKWLKNNESKKSEELKDELIKKVNFENLF